MRWLTTEWIKEHSRIDYSLEDSLLTMYGNAAEAMVLNTTGRTYDEIVEKWGAPSPTSETTAPLFQAALMLVDLSYMMRSPINAMNMYAVDYTYDFLLKPYMKLADDEEESEESE